MKQEKWFNRSFDFSSNQQIFPAIIERLVGTPARLEEKLLLIPENITIIQVDGKWSVKENVGHLSDLEPLWQDRLEDILNGQSDLRPTDLTNRKTTEANHNAVPIETLLERFRKLRMRTIDLLKDLNEEQILKFALHPRLKTPMRTMDLFLFVAEHDDHHLARITELIKLIDGSKE
jgi:uncharacterized damage-inducible protein DinB